MIFFIIGIFIGIALGVTLMCSVQINKDKEKRSDENELLKNEGDE